jgi:hypothetical protein
MSFPSGENLRAKSISIININLPDIYQSFITGHTGNTLEKSMIFCSIEPFQFNLYTRANNKKIRMQKKSDLKLHLVSLLCLKALTNLPCRNVQVSLTFCNNLTTI